MKKLIVAALAAAGLVGALVAPAGAATTTTVCYGALHSPITGPVSVPLGAHCQLTGADKATDVTVASGGNLIVETTRVSSITAYGPVALRNSTVVGPVSISRTSQPSVICSSVTYGTVTFADNSGGLSFSPETGCPYSSFVGGSVVLTGNTAPIGRQSVYIFALSIDQSLVCSGNTPKPSINGVTTTFGTRQGQCAT